MKTVNELQHDTNRTTISLSKKNYQKLKELGYTGESFDTVVSRLLEKLEDY
jgi:predicted CopG family antitoxin